jgi:polyisoprenoid-binding protein YceI
LIPAVAVFKAIFAYSTRNHDILTRRRFVKKWIALPFALTLLALLGISGCANPADDVAPATVSEAKPIPPSAAPAKLAPADSASKAASPPALSTGAPVIAPDNTTIGFVGSKVTGSHTGGFKSFKGTFEVVPSKLESSKITAEIDTNSIFADNGGLTNHLKSPEFFDVAKFPTSTFVSTGIEVGGKGAKAKDSTHTVTGNLTLHGVTKSISFPAKIAVTSDNATLDSEFFINRKDFGINYPGKANDLIRDEVVIKLAVHVPLGSSTPQEAATK